MEVPRKENTMNLLIRELEVDDLDNLPEIDDSFIVNSRLILSLSKVNRRIEYTVEDVPSYEKSYLQNNNEELACNEYINKPNQVIYIALLHNQIIGFIVLKKNWNHYAYIEDIKVDKKYRSLGVGRRLIEQAKQWAKESNMRFWCKDCIYLKEVYRFLMESILMQPFRIVDE